MAPFGSVIQYLFETGVIDVLLPFVLVFTLCFAFFCKVNIFPEKRHAGIVSLILGLSFIVPHVVPALAEYDLIPILNSFLPNVSMFVIVIVMVLLVLGVFGVGLNPKSGIVGVAMLFAALLVLYIFGAAAEWWSVPDTMSFVLDPETQAFIVIIIVFLIVIWAVTHESKKGPKDENPLLKAITEMFKPPK